MFGVTLKYITIIIYMFYFKMHLIFFLKNVILKNVSESFMTTEMSNGTIKKKNNNLIP